MAQTSSANDSPGARLRAVLDAFNQVGGVGALELIPDLYTDDVVFRDPLQTVVGKEAFMAMNRRFFDKGQQLDVEVHDFMETGDQIFCSWTMRFRPRLGPAITVEGATHARVRDGQIAYHRDYWDLLGSVFASLPAVGPLYQRLVRRLG